MRLLREDDGRECVLAGSPLARGGEATLHAVAGAPGLVAKLYHRPTAGHADKLAAMLAAPPVDPRDPQPPVAWPVARLLESDSRHVVGCLLPHVQGAFRLCEVYNPAARQRVWPKAHYGDLLWSARNLAAAVRGLHERGHVVGDLNESNVLVTSRGEVTLVDADSFQVHAAGRVYRCGVGKAEYAPPELQGACLAEVDRRPEHDAFALAALVFQMLMQGSHPFAGVPSGGGEPEPIPARIRAGHWPYAWGRDVPCRPAPHAPPWAVLPPSVQELLLRCFEDGHAAPERRPDAAAWQQALAEAEAGLRACRSNARHRSPRGLDTCPWCVLARQHGRDPFPGDGPAAAPRAPSRLAATPAAPPALDPNDPLPPRPAPRAAELPPGPAAAPPEPPSRRPAARPFWALWMAAIAAGTVVGAVMALGKFQLQGDNPPAEAARPDPARVAEAEHAWRQALADLQKAQVAWEQAVRRHEQAVKEFARGRITKQDLSLCARLMRKHMSAVQARERVLAEKARVWSEMQQALAHDKP